MAISHRRLLYVHLLQSAAILMTPVAVTPVLSLISSMRFYLAFPGRAPYICKSLISITILFPTFQSQSALKALIEEHSSGSLRGLADLDARLMALQAKVTSQKEEFEVKLSEVSKCSVRIGIKTWNGVIGETLETCSIRVNKQGL